MSLFTIIVSAELNIAVVEKWALFIFATSNEGRFPAFVSNVTNKEHCLKVSGVKFSALLWPH